MSTTSRSTRGLAALVATLCAVQVVSGMAVPTAVPGANALSSRQLSPQQLVSADPNFSTHALGNSDAVLSALSQLSIDPTSATISPVTDVPQHDSASADTLLARTPQPTPSPSPSPSPTRTHFIVRQQYNPDSQSINFPQFTTYIPLPDPVTTTVHFGDSSNLNTSVPLPRGRGSNESGNGEAPININNPDSPDLGWLDTFVGAVPYKNGDIAASVVFLLATIGLLPLLLIRLLRRSSLISMVLGPIILFILLVMIGFGMRAKLANDTPTTKLMIGQTFIFAILLPLLLEPILHLLGLYSQQAGRPTGVPVASTVLRVFNFIVFVLYLVAAALDASWLSNWDDALRNTERAQELPGIQPPSFTRIAPVVASVVFIILVFGTALLIPVARGDGGSLRPGGFIFLLLLLLLVSAVWRTLQTLHASSRLSAENGGTLNSNDLLPFFAGGKPATDDERVANGLSLAPQGMYGPNSKGIAWQQLQLTMASRGPPQTPVIFYLVYILPMWLMVLLLFFAHAPAGKSKEKEASKGDAAAAAA